MYKDNSFDYERLVRDGINAAKDGNRRLAWSLLNQASDMNPLDPRPWLWLTETTEDLAEKKEYLEHALAADPRNYVARRGLAALSGRILADSPAAVAEYQPSTSGEPVFARSTQTFLCPSCGAHMQFDIKRSQLVCTYCGHSSEQDEELSAADAETHLESILPTARGQRWASSQQQLVCQRCGAHSLWPPGQKAARCPYCSSSQLIVSTDTEGLVDPQAIAVMQINRQEAEQKAQEWFGRGWFAPDDLKQSARKSPLNPAYYPFWTFDGTLNVHWSCEVNEGSNNRPHWVARSGVEFEMFDDVLVPGLQAIRFKDLNGISPYNLKDVVAFDPDILAGWPAMTYDRPLAKATLLGREQVMRAFRRELHARVMTGQQKRNLQTGGINWTDMTFKHVLLPVWIGSYQYRGKDYRILINGQTGKVSGEKPRDAFKTIGIILAVVVTVLVIVLLGIAAAYSLGLIG